MWHVCLGMVSLLNMHPDSRSINKLTKINEIIFDDSDYAYYKCIQLTRIMCWLTKIYELFLVMANIIDQLHRQCSALKYPMITIVECLFYLILCTE